VLAIWAGETAQTTLVMSAYVSCEVCFSRESTGAEGALIAEVWEERRHDLGVISAVALFAEGLMLEGMSPSGVAAFLTGVEFVKFVGREWSNAKEGMEEDLRVFVISGEDGIDGEQGE